MVVATLMTVAAAVASTVTPQYARFPGDEAELAVYSEAMTPIPGVTVSLFARGDYAAALAASGGKRAIWVGVTDPQGRTRLTLPEPGEYVLLLELPGFLSVVLGPLQVCARGQSACGPVLRSPVQAVLPVGAFLD